jgi:starch synthase (maltosyl-transferring)
LQDFRNIVFLNAWHDDVLAYARMNPKRDGCIFVMVNLDPHQRRDCVYEAPLWEFGLPDDASIEVEDLLFGGRFRLYGKTHQIALDPVHNPVVIWRFIAPDTFASTERTA